MFSIFARVYPVVGVCMCGICTPSVCIKGNRILVRAPCEMYWKCILNFSNQTKISTMKSVSNLILAVEVRCHKVQGMTDAFTDTQKRAIQFTKKPYLPLFLLSETADKFAKDYAIKRKASSCPAPCDSAPPPPESSCSHSSY